MEIQDPAAFSVGDWQVLLDILLLNCHWRGILTNSFEKSRLGFLGSSCLDEGTYGSYQENGTQHRHNCL